MLCEVIGLIGSEGNVTLCPPGEVSHCVFASVGIVTHAYTNLSDMKVRNGEVGASSSAWDDEK